MNRERYGWPEGPLEDWVVVAAAAQELDELEVDSENEVVEFVDVHDAAVVVVVEEEVVLDEVVEAVVVEDDDDVELDW